MRRGFTLIEVVIALVVLELAVVGAAGLFVIASATLVGAERMERAAALAEGLLDSLAAESVPAPGEARLGWGDVRWNVGAGGELTLVALGPAGDTLFELTTIGPAP
jgi:prepilin-type N-terminal cleavage/methylation domain-containing protein